MPKKTARQDIFSPVNNMSFSQLLALRKGKLAGKFAAPHPVGINAN